jgi:hypothetical protein
VPIKELSRLVSGKNELYSALLYKGQLYLPPRSVCTLAFLGQVLQGRKRVFIIFETCPIELETRYAKILTLKVVIDKIGSD